MHTSSLQPFLPKKIVEDLSVDSLRRWYEASPVMLHVLDMDGRILLVSRLWLEVLGYERADVVNIPITNFLTAPSSSHSDQEVLPRFLATGIVENAEFQMVRKDGTKLDVLISAALENQASGAPPRIVGVVKDVTAQRTVEKELDCERERLTNILEGTQAATWEWNLQTHELKFNRRWAQMIGWEPEELAPPTFEWLRDQIHPDDLANYAVVLEKHCVGESDRLEYDLRVRHRDGSWRWVEDCGAIRSWTSDGRPEWMFGTRVDIHERKAQEEALRKSNEFLDRTGAMAGIGGWQVDLVAGTVEWSPETYRIHRMPSSYQPTLAEGLSFYAPEARPAITEAVERTVAGGIGWDLELPVIRSDGERILVRTVGTPTTENGRVVRLSGVFQDITLMRSLADELAAQHELLRVTLDSIGDAVITADAHGSITWLNPVAERMTGWPQDQACGMPAEVVFKLIDEPTGAPIGDPIARCLLEDCTIRLEHGAMLHSRHGLEYGVEVSASPIRGSQGEVPGAVLIFHDVSEQRRLSKEIRHRATHDPLTGLWNRAEFELRLSHLLQRSQDGEPDSAQLFIDLDQFKVVNDSCGHTVGDQLLVRVAELLTESVRVNDVVARLGGDEFGILLEQCPFSQAMYLAQRICDRMDEFRFTHGDRRFRVGVSIGLVRVHAEWDSTATILQAADSSCYAAKEAGRNRIHTWNDSDSSMAVRRGETRWASRLEDALDEGSFVLFAQRYEHLGGSNERIYAEVLIRMRGKDGTLIQPGSFLPAAERFHLASRVDRWVFEKVIAHLETDADLDLLSCLNINLSGQSLSDRAFHAWMIERLTGCSDRVCRTLCLEITETAAVTNLADAAEFIQQVRRLGVRVALDDFGSGASWFGYLSKMRVDYLKIDGQFIRDLLTNPLSEATVRCFADVAATMNLQTVAEWVENTAVEDRLRRMGIGFAQGYSLHRPSPIEELWQTPAARQLHAA